MGSSPVHKHRFGNVTLSKFENTNSKDGKSFTTASYTLQKSYKVGDKTKFTNSLKPNEMMFAIQCLQEALIDYYRKSDEPKLAQNNNVAPF